MSEKDALIIEALDKLTKATQALTTQTLEMHDFLSENFRGYNRHGYLNTYPLVAASNTIIDKLKMLTSSNADHKHLLSKEQEEKKESSKGVRMSPYVTSYILTDELPISHEVLGPPAQPYSPSTYSRHDYDPDLDF